MNWPARSILIACLVACVAASAQTRDVGAADYPTRPIKFVVPYPPGGPTDILARVIADFIGKDLKQATVIENKPGAQGAIGAEFVARADPDGYTLLVPAGSMIVQNPLLYKKLSYDPARDFRMLALVTDFPVLMEVHPSVPAKTIAEFVTYARQNPGKLNFGSAGTGGTIHLAGEMFKRMAGIEMTHVPQGRRARFDRPAGRQHPGDVRLREHGASAGAIRPVAPTRRQFGGAISRTA
jgi:tripartite-type tricarboxylate transporter receptor subunit TctC